MTGTTRPARSAFTISPSSSDGNGRVRRRETGFVAEDLRLESFELGAGLDSELVDEAGARILVDLQGFGLPARTIQRKHQLPAKRLAERMVAHERLELADHVSVLAELEIGVDPLAEDDEPQLLEPPGLRLCEVVERELSERWTPPQIEGGLQSVASLLCGEAASRSQARARNVARRSERARP